MLFRSCIAFDTRVFMIYEWTKFLLQKKKNGSKKVKGSMAPPSYLPQFRWP